MIEKSVDGILVRQVRTNLWVSEYGDVWMENVGIPRNNGLAPLYVDKWHTTKAKTRVKVGDELRYRLVAEAWVNNPTTYHIVNHLDGVPTNDVATNLEWCDVSRNTQHAYDIGLNSSKEQTNENLRRFTDEEEKAIHFHYTISNAKNRLDNVSYYFVISRGLL